MDRKNVKVTNHLKTKLLVWLLILFIFHSCLGSYVSALAETKIERERLWKEIYGKTTGELNKTELEKIYRKLHETYGISDPLKDIFKENPEKLKDFLNKLKESPSHSLRLPKTEPLKVPPTKVSQTPWSAKYKTEIQQLNAQVEPLAKKLLSDSFILTYQQFNDEGVAIVAADKTGRKVHVESQTLEDGLNEIRKELDESSPILVIGEKDREIIDRSLEGRLIFFCREDKQESERGIKNLNNLCYEYVFSENIKLVNFLPVTNKQSQQMKISKKAQEVFVRENNSILKGLDLPKERNLTFDYNRKPNFFERLVLWSLRPSPQKAKENFIKQLRKLSADGNYKVIVSLVGHCDEGAIWLSKDVKLTAEDFPLQSCKNMVFLLFPCEAGKSMIPEFLRTKGGAKAVYAFDQKVPIDNLDKVLIKIFNPENQWNIPIRLIDFLEKTKNDVHTQLEIYGHLRVQIVSRQKKFQV